MVGYLQIHNKGYLYIINPIVSEMVIGAEGRYRIHACLICLTFFVEQLDIREREREREVYFIK